jgi:hypothetical protein
MSRDHFILILQCFHSTNLKPGELISDDLVMKIRLFLDPFNSTIDSVYC